LRLERSWSRPGGCIPLKGHVHADRTAERHFIGRTGWLRAAVLGANDGIISTASLIVGVATAETSATAVITAGVAGMIAGAMSMAAGEYVSVSSQSDTEGVDLARERRKLSADAEAETDELAQIYVSRGVEPKVARQVAEQLMAKDALGAHAQDELGITETTTPNPIQAALSSAASLPWIELVQKENELIVTGPQAGG
jgi:VIT1/CCC1 family predicted Fe2+/Mn2+ transporter